jgi:hypothetical protein
MKLRRGRKSKKPRPSESASPAIEHFRLTMTEQDAAQIILVRSLEEIDPKTFPPSRLSEALTAAGSDLRPSSWFLTRARYLLESVPHPYGPIVRMAQLPAGWTIALCAFPAHRLGDQLSRFLYENPDLAEPAGSETNRPAQVFWDGVITSSSNLTRLRNDYCAPKPTGVSAGSAHRTWEH